MTNTYTLSNSLPLEFEKALTKVTNAVIPLNVPYFIAGATARDIVLHGVFGHPLKVSSLPGISMLKLMAWDERGDESNKDATDFYTVLSKYELIHDGRLWEDYVPGEALDYDIKKQAAFLLGFDLKDLLSEATQTVLARVKEEKHDALITAITRTHKSAQVDEVERQLEAFWMGIYGNIEGN